MSESVILQVTTMVLSLVSTLFSAWLLAKYGALAKSSDHAVTQNEKIIRQNEVQERKIDQTKEEINGRVKELIDVRVAAAIKDAVAAALREERLSVAELAVSMKDKT